MNFEKMILSFLSSSEREGLGGLAPTSDYQPSEADFMCIPTTFTTTLLFVMVYKAMLTFESAEKAAKPSYSLQRVIFCI